MATPSYVGNPYTYDDGDSQSGQDAGANGGVRFSPGVTDGTWNFHDDAPYIPLTPRLADAVMLSFAVLGIIVFFFAVPDEDTCTHSPALQWLLVTCVILLELWVAYYVWILYVWKGGLRLNRDWGPRWDNSGD